MNGSYRFSLKEIESLFFSTNWALVAAILLNQFPIGDGSGMTGPKRFLGMASA
jgi:hypothetical protein